MVNNCAMDPNLIIGLVSFAFVTSITPGPNNLMLMASGANFGFRRSVLHMLGINLGFLSLVLAAGFGLAALMIAVPAAKTALKIAAVALHAVARLENRPRRPARSRRVRRPAR